MEIGEQAFKSRSDWYQHYAIPPTTPSDSYLEEVGRFAYVRMKKKKWVVTYTKLKYSPKTYLNDINLLKNQCVFGHAWEPYQPVYYFYREMDPECYTTKFTTWGTQSIFSLGECLLILFIMGEECKEKLHIYYSII